MSERSRRATEAVETHYAFLDACRTGSTKDHIEGSLLDCAKDPTDVRFGHGDFLYGKGRSFQDWQRDIANRARTFTATTDLMREVALTVDMMAEEEIDWLPLLPHHVPAQTGMMLFPWGMEDPTHIDRGVHIQRKRMNAFQDSLSAYDSGGGARHHIDGFLWDVTDKVAKDGHAGPPVSGVMVLPLTRWRGDPTDRPFRLHYHLHPDTRPVPIVASDVTAWAFDDEDSGTEWGIPPSLNTELLDGFDRTEQLENVVEKRLWVRSLVWATFRWLSEEVWIPESPDNRQTTRKMNRARPVIHENAPEDGMVTIVDLRLERKEAVARGEAGGEPPWWRSRWIVRGHWAKRRYAIRHPQTNEPVGPTRGPGSVEGVTFAYKRVWIDPYEKGPDSAPLVLRDRVGVLCR